MTLVKLEVERIHSILKSLYRNRYKDDLHSCTFESEDCSIFVECKGEDLYSYTKTDFKTDERESKYETFYIVKKLIIESKPISYDI